MQVRALEQAPVPVPVLVLVQVQVLVLEQVLEQVPERALVPAVV